MRARQCRYWTQKARLAGVVPKSENKDMPSWMHSLVCSAKKILPRGYHLYLFGSRAGRLPNATSDYDLGILGTRPLPVGLITRLEILGDELPTLDKLDWVDLGRSTRAFRKTALSRAVRLA